MLVGEDCTVDNPIALFIMQLLIVLCGQFGEKGTTILSKGQRNLLLRSSLFFSFFLFYVLCSIHCTFFILCAWTFYTLESNSLVDSPVPQILFCSCHTKSIT